MELPVQAAEPNAVDLADYHRPGHRPPVAVAAGLGRVLAELHRQPLKALPPKHGHPAFLTPHHPEPEFSHTAAQDLVRIVNATKGFGERLDAAGATWSSVARTHQDVRESNILVRGKRRRLTLIGWELAGPGDPRWDIGCALAGYLSLWISSVPDWSLAPQRPLRTVQPAIRACWDGYATDMGMKGDAGQWFLVTTLPFVAVRLVSAAMESARASHRPTAEQLLHLQVAHNILERPRDAAARLIVSEGSAHRRA